MQSIIELILIKISLQIDDGKHPTSYSRPVIYNEKKPTRSIKFVFYLESY